MRNLSSALVFTCLITAACGPTSQGSNDSSGQEAAANALENLANEMDAKANQIVASPESTNFAGSWSYSTDEDKLRGGATYTASVVSSNTVAQAQPYDSNTSMTMMVRRSPAYGTDVILVISSGQMMCPSYEGCSGTVRFDNDPPQRIRFNGPEDNGSETVFVVGAKSFIAKLKKSKRVIVEKTLYQAGSPQFEFDVAGLKWDH